MADSSCALPLRAPTNRNSPLKTARVGAGRVSAGTGAPLVDEDDVAAGLNAAKQLLEISGQFRGALARTAREKEQGIGGGIALQGREDHDLQRDFAAHFGGPVFPHIECAAISVTGSVGRFTGLEMVERGGLPEARAGRQHERGGKQTAAGGLL